MHGTKVIHWFTHAIKYRVEHVAVSYLTGHIDRSKPHVGVMHTTETSFDSALQEFKTKFAPHFLVGKGRIIQFAPLGVMSHALEHQKGTVETNRWARVQIEVTAKSHLNLWQPDEETFDTLAALVAVVSGAAEIPLKRLWPDQLDKHVVWATPKNPRRKQNVWGKEAGWFGHIEVPGNSHWDPGSLNYTALFARAQQLSRLHTAHSLSAGP
jgi:N-acetylmuramoyl-L-alanine amidase